jgi:hypothetical protein
MAAAIYAIREKVSEAQTNLVALIERLKADQPRVPKGR